VAWNLLLAGVMKNAITTTSFVRSHAWSASLVLAAALFATAAAPALASPRDTDQSAARKLGRGAADVVAGVLELPGNMVEAHDREGAAGLPLGFAKGVGMIAVREAVGVYEIVTSPFPVPAGYRPAIRPEYPWDYFDRHEDRRSDRDRDRHPAS
jgi:putative exosortase-associated protein (TIGR04073 family)